MNITKERVKGNAIFWISLLLLWIGSMAAMYLLGRAGRAVPQPASPSAPPVSGPVAGMATVKEPRETDFVDATSESTAEETIPAGEDAIEPEEILEVVAGDVRIPIPLFSPEELDRNLRSALESRDELYRDLVFSQILYQVTRENAPGIASALISKKPGRETMNRFITAWVRLDGPAAMAFAQGPGLDMRSSDGGSVSVAVRSWAKSEPEACLDYLNNRGLAEEHLLAYLEGSAAYDSVLFQSFVAGLEDPKFRQKAVWAMADGMRNQPNTMLDWAERVINMDDADPSFVRQVLRSVMGMENPDLLTWVARNADSPWITTAMFYSAAREGGKADPLAALEWINQRASDSRVTDQVFEAWVEGWARTDAPGLASWLADHADDPRVTLSRLEKSMNQWAKEEPEAAAAWVERNKGSKLVTGHAAASVVKQWIWKAPYETRSWIDSLPSDMQRWPSMYAAKQWPQGELDEFAKWLDKSGANAIFDHARGALAERYIDIDPKIALALPETITEPELRERKRVQMAEKLMESNPDAVEAWLPGSGLSEETRERILLKEPNR